MLWYRWVPLFRLRRQWGWEGFGPLDSLNSDQKRVALLVKRDEKEARPAPAGTRSHPAFCYSAAALHGNRKTPASSLIHDLPFQEKKQNRLSRIICVFFFKLGMRSNSICFRACIQAVGNAAGCCQVTKALPSTGATAPVARMQSAPLEAATGVISVSPPIHRAVAQPGARRGRSAPGSLEAQEQRRSQAKTGHHPGNEDESERGGKGCGRSNDSGLSQQQAVTASDH